MEYSVSRSDIAAFAGVSADWSGHSADKSSDYVRLRSYVEKHLSSFIMLIYQCLSYSLNPCHYYKKYLAEYFLMV